MLGFALVAVAVPAYVIYWIRQHHDQQFRSDRLIWWHAPYLVRILSRRGAGPVRKLAFAQSVFAIFAVPGIAAITVAISVLPTALVLPAVILFTFWLPLALAPTLAERILGWYWHRQAHAAHRRLLEAWVATIDALPDEVLCRLGEAFGRQAELVDPAAAAAPPATFTTETLKVDLERGGRRPATTFEMADVNGMGMAVAFRRMERTGVRKQYLARHLVWTLVSWRLGPELARGLQSAWMTCWAVVARDRFPSDVTEAVLEPWREVIGPVPGLDVPA